MRWIVLAVGAAAGRRSVPKKAENHRFRAVAVPAIAVDTFDVCRDAGCGCQLCARRLQDVSMQYLWCLVVYIKSGY